MPSSSPSLDFFPVPGGGVARLAASQEKGADLPKGNPWLPRHTGSALKPGSERFLQRQEWKRLRQRSRQAAFPGMPTVSPRWGAFGGDSPPASPPPLSAPRLTFVVEAAHGVGEAGCPLQPVVRGGCARLARVPAVQVQHVGGHHGVPAGGGSPLQAEHAEQPQLELAQDFFRGLGRGAASGCRELPPAQLGNETGRAAQEDLGKQQR